MARLYVGRVSADARERDVEHLFGKYGRTRDVTLKNGFGFVEFDDVRDADDAMRDLHGRDFMGDRLIVERANSGGRRDRGEPRERRFAPPTRTQYRVLVENLSTRISWQDLKDFVRTCGVEVTFADAHRERDGTGVVEFANSTDMRHAIRRLDGKDLNGRDIRLREDRPRDRSRSRSRSPRRDRSSSRSPRRDERRRSPSPAPADGAGAGSAADDNGNRARSRSPAPRSPAPRSPSPARD
ncbi:hypothetical protein CAOG_03309 [Capsaspora owczarzaki ATCC 30864]|uniref:RRM domain-containing protein n=1 Tax=Capsaspora owczarzaki (strain ATCC 30864) TaxID=595528 RepID=A0A0D2WP16_CAPO3|nr:hypothetical protein CAOG_03309 [Capsaspora owczarzaki ATCC 30864]KJE92308.1 hypothetical protein CAOG_003309 [Capsaspora owczarzaki ATCC 30864]|eukprot:XP_004364148.1 hypothetical protein CAOG_03309 [Capsaspora owczarzaki ATCC 30864]